jgi:hypothetical protein
VTVIIQNVTETFFEQKYERIEMCLVPIMYQIIERKENLRSADALSRRNVEKSNSYIQISFYLMKDLLTTTHHVSQMLCSKCFQRNLMPKVDCDLAVGRFYVKELDFLRLIQIHHRQRFLHHLDLA